MNEKQQTSIFFEDDDVIVRSAFKSSEECFVTFTSLNHARTKGFGEDFFFKNGYSAVHVMAKWNHWYQLPQMDSIIDMIWSEIRRRRISCTVTYGSSMGGCGALVYSRALEAKTVIAFSPQFNIDPKEPPFEKRWSQDADKIRFDEEKVLKGVSSRAVKYYFFDPNNADERHVELYTRLDTGVQVKTNFAEHHVAEVLKNAGLLQKIVLAIAKNTFSLSDFYKQYHVGRRLSALYWNNVGARASLRRPNVALFAADHGLLLDPNDLRLHVTRCIALLRLGREEEAAKAAYAALAVRFDHPAPWRVISIAMQRLRRWDEAIDAAQSAVRWRPNDPDLQRVLLDAYLQSGRYSEAARQARVAIELAPAYAASYVRGAEALEANGEIKDALEMVFKGCALLTDDNVMYHKLKAAENRLWSKLTVGQG